MNSATDNVRASSLPDSLRVTNLDSIRGLAVLGILVMNAVSFGLVPAAYFNLSAGGNRSWLDWIIGAAGEVLVDQKTMALFSMLFGTGIVLFADRAAAKSDHPVALSLWRNFLLLLIGLAHSMVSEGDVLVIYALCAPFLVLMRNVRPRRLLIAGATLVLWSAALAPIVQRSIPADGLGLGDYWLTDGSPMSDLVGLFLINDFFARSSGMMLIGVALYRLEIIQGTKPAEFYRRMALCGLGIGLPIALAGLAFQVASDFSPAIAVIGEVPNTIATIPIALGYLALITLWNQRPVTRIHKRVRAVGRMALTNYLAQTLLGIVILGTLADPATNSRTTVIIFVLAVAGIQLAWSLPWLNRFRYGPAEWLWRCGTYRRREPLRRRPAGEGVNGP
ncbi:unannotated protein [freshwater metagenome]|uniref:Unannotated protein n=1 Tax=freshwater metagenome TaxID=449393 RepID=A0A6J6I916_9ZZZZ